MSFLGRILALGRWLCAAETLGNAPPGAPPGPGLCDYFLRAGQLPTPPDAPPADQAAAARPTFLGWLLKPEQLPRAEGARPPRAES